jgi:hypothetical protein
MTWLALSIGALATAVAWVAVSRRGRPKPATHRNEPTRWPRIVAAWLFAAAAVGGGAYFAVKGNTNAVRIDAALVILVLVAMLSRGRAQRPQKDESG